MSLSQILIEKEIAKIKAQPLAPYLTEVVNAMLTNALPADQEKYASQILNNPQFAASTLQKKMLDLITAQAVININTLLSKPNLTAAEIEAYFP